MVIWVVRVKWIHGRFFGNIFKKLPDKNWSDQRVISIWRRLWMSLNRKILIESYEDNQMKTIIIMEQLQSSCFKRHVASIMNGRSTSNIVSRLSALFSFLTYSLWMRKTSNNCKYIKKFNIRLTSNNDFSPFLFSGTILLLFLSLTVAYLTHRLCFQSRG